MFKRILVANRGEIAVRLFAACRELGVESVAIYSEADAVNNWWHSADYAYPLTGTSATDSYLNQDQIFTIAKEANVDAIHPGYGFLSENADFAANCAKHGFKFIGPSPEAMRVMGGKASAREVAIAAGVPVTPGVDGAGKSAEQLQQAANEMGYPVLIKASAGGGGKGMRVVESAEDFPDALQAARSEAANSFGDDHIILEKYLTAIHHIEIQILGDEHGNVLHFFERECSIQRRHQKIIEETPSPNLTDSVRQEIAQAAVALAQSVGYSSAGTVEFMYTADGNFYLLEMNTRLQVEHPITELVTGVDLAQWQIRVAAGKPLTLAQSDITQRGHAIECRLYAEDPAQNFLPSTGEIAYCHFPTAPSIRIDSGITSGSVITPYYDPMLAKVITYGHNREEAIARMATALNDTALIGVTTNIPYLQAILTNQHFRAGETTTSYLDQHFEGWQNSADITPELLAAMAAFEAFSTAPTRQQNRQQPATVPDPWSNDQCWRNLA